MKSIDVYIYIVIGILGAAYPLMFQVIARIEDKYLSNRIARIFENEKRYYVFKCSLIASLISLFFWTLQLHSPEKFNCIVLDYVIENSAVFLLTLSTITLVSSFLLLIDLIRKYYTPEKLVDYLINKYKMDNNIEYFDALSFLLLHSIKHPELNITDKLRNYYYDLFKEYRENTNNNKVVYPSNYYQLIYNTIQELVTLDDKRNQPLEYRVAGCLWLFGEFNDNELSDETYTWIWRILRVSVEYKKDDYIMHYWENANRYYSFGIKNIEPKYNYSNDGVIIENQEEVDRKKNVRQKFIEFNFALGGLLAYSNMYECIKRLFSYTNSQPAEYPLLPTNMSEIFYYYMDVVDTYDRKYSWISSIFPFPKLDGISSDGVIKKWISFYMAILFLRQYSLQSIIYGYEPLGFPNYPDNLGEIDNWINKLGFFTELTKNILNDEDILLKLGLDFITEEWCTQNKKIYPIKYLEDLKLNLKNKYELTEITQKIDVNKKLQYLDSSKSILENSLHKIQLVSNKALLDTENTERCYQNGSIVTMSKDAFSKTPSAHYQDFDNFLANHVSEMLFNTLSFSFIKMTSKTYSLKQENMFKAIDELSLNDDYILITFGLRLDYYINSLLVSNLSKTNYKNLKLYDYTSTRYLNSSIFIMNKKDLPSIFTIEIPKEVKDKFNLGSISNEYTILTNVIDFNEHHELIDEYKGNKSKAEITKQALLLIVLSVEYKWKKDIKVIHLKEYSEFKQEGLANKVEDVKF